MSYTFSRNKFVTIQFYSLLVSAFAMLSALAETTIIDSSVGEWKSALSERKESLDKPPEFETTLCVKKNHQFVLRRTSTNSKITTVYTGIISEKDGRLIAKVILGPVVCGPSKPIHDWTVTIDSDRMTLSYSDTNKESFVRSTKD